ncbi:MAG: hypothetical protein ABFD92_08270 [Planctomycetaceae bacterium]|nr:hypothetical protein [Planctomycetaceae bacterium]
MTESERQSNRDSLFTLAAAGLLVLIIVLLSVLWYRERQGRLAAESRVAAMAAMGAGAGVPVNEMLVEMVHKQAGAVQPFARADLERTQELVVAGQVRQALVISAAAGQRLGFLAGDVVIVDKAPAAVPATAPATREQRP